MGMRICPAKCGNEMKAKQMVCPVCYARLPDDLKKRLADVCRSSRRGTTPWIGVQMDVLSVLRAT